jgi:protoheme IX farnesyltransferase
MKSMPAAMLTRRRSALAERLADYVALTKPRIAALLLVTVVAGGLVTGHGAADPLLLAHAVLGTALLAAAASVLNPLAERKTDALMQRTANRPLPAGRIQPADALALAIGTALAGVAYLWTTAGSLAAMLALATLVVYVWVYTPLKRATSLNTMVGAVAGATGPLIGSAAVSGRIGLDAFVLASIVFLWQFPHFLAIAWLYRDDYARAELCMLPTSDLGQRMIGPAVVSYTLALLPISLLPSVLGAAGNLYFWGTFVLGIQFLGCGVYFALEPSKERARLVLWSSLLYLPAVLALLLVDLTRYHV